MEKLPPVSLWHDTSIRTASGVPSVTPMLCAGEEKRPAVLVIPGGGYGCVCESTEGSPIGKKFNELGVHAFILDYRTAPSRWPEPQLDAMRAMKIIAGNADKWHVDAEKIISCGFSAGAHLAGSLGILCDGLDASAQDEYDKFSHRPFAMILCYGVLSFADWSHRGTRRNLLGSDDSVLAEKFSLTSHVNENTPPAFLMHTVCDQSVSFRNSMEFASAMAKAGRPCELSLNYWGEHGMLLGNGTLDVANWPVLAMDFIRTLEAAADDPAYLTRYTNGWQSTHL